ncbi:hypothetical protein GCM10028785_13020 [Hydrogenophaga soli]
MLLPALKVPETVPEDDVVVDDTANKPDDALKITVSPTMATLLASFATAVIVAVPPLELMDAAVVVSSKVATLVLPVPLVEVTVTARDKVAPAESISLIVAVPLATGVKVSADPDTDVVTTDVSLELAA